MGYLDKIRACNNARAGDFVPWRIGARPVGWLLRPFAAELVRWPEIFRVGDGRVALHESLAGFDARTAALETVTRALVSEGVIARHHGERFPVTPGGRDEALATLDRAAAAHFGVRAFGQHVNGYVRRGDGLWMWVARRAADKVNEPGRLDQMVAGGLPHGISPADNLRKECAEEAALPAAVAARAVAAGTVTYCRQSSAGLKPDTLLCYDLELAEDEVPRVHDGEVAGFELWPVAAVAAAVRDGDDFKTNCNLVVIDFLVRHGVLRPDEPDYATIVQQLRSPTEPAGPR